MYNCNEGYQHQGQDIRKVQVMDDKGVLAHKGVQWDASPTSASWLAGLDQQWLRKVYGRVMQVTLVHPNCEKFIWTLVK